MIYKIKNILLVVVASLFLMNCNKDLQNDISFINNLSNDMEYDIPFESESIIILLKREDKLFISSIRMLFDEYSKHYKAKYTFDEFLVMVINNMFTKEQMNNISVHNFKLDGNVSNLYNNKGLDYLISEYCEKTNKHNTLFLKQNLSVEVQFNVVYYFFKNNYYLLEDDYQGRFILINKN